MDSQESKKKPKDQFKDILGRIYYFINSNDFKIITGIIIAYYLYFELNGIKLINNYLVEHVLKHLDSDSFFTISITILTALTLVFIKHYRGFKIHARPNTKTTYIIILFAILYTIERWIHIDEYTMYKFSYVNISYIDFLLGTLLIANLWQWYGYKRFILLQQNQKKGQGFIKDTVFKENNNGEYTLKQDKLGREQFTQKLKDFILNSKNKEQEGSLNIGLEGPWGSGKTYMLKQLNQELEVEAITIEFNPWRSINTENIISDFFHTLATELKRYDAGIQTNLLKYLNLILDSVDVKTGPFSFRFQNLEIRQKDLNKQIRKLAKPVIIFIDDLDRLDDKEIREVLKLIRNTADFTNTVFVSAFNEEYIKKALKEDNADKANDASYIEKIFQIIFHLPEIDENELIQDLEKLIIDNSKIIKLNFENDLQEIFSDLRCFERIKENIRTYRQALKFTNLLTLDIEFIPYDIEFKDFFLFELIKYRDYRLLYDLFNNTSNYLETDPKQQKYRLLGNESDEFNKYKGLEDSFKNLLQDLFVGDKPNSISKPTNFQKYFSLSIFPNDLSNNEFISSLIDKENSIIKTIEGWRKENKSIATILAKFENPVIENIITNNPVLKKKILTRLISGAKFISLNLGSTNQNIFNLIEIYKNIKQKIGDHYDPKEYQECFLTGFNEPNITELDIHFFQEMLNVNISKPAKNFTLIGINKQKIYEKIKDLYENELINRENLTIPFLLANFSTIRIAGRQEYSYRTIELTRTFLLPKIDLLINKYQELNLEFKIQLEALGLKNDDNMIDLFKQNIFNFNKCNKEYEIKKVINFWYKWGLNQNWDIPGIYNYILNGLKMLASKHDKENFLKTVKSTIDGNYKKEQKDFINFIEKKYNEGLLNN